ncbi:TonB-dependent receptor [Sphingobacterium faecium NBRC 15299]|uniref:TonB-dependent receptor n=1 Tax=Sphingobacterium faecium TaxID=34087 RepID=UPI000D37BF8E|nr:TonB-dependent receptor [Sphingobacterium faecium]PTX11737.1 iron complex outermembrane receptor protein [Sphingobacterium faecium]GEM63478.1 TonB-dependent receptor [Sphingobacterium faecium NBRC 15299]
MNFLLLSTQLFSRTWKKNSLFLALSLTCLWTQAQQGILHTKVSIQLKNQTIAQALEQIEEKTGCTFIYSPNLIDAHRKVTIDLQNTRLETILQEILGDAVKRVESKGNRINLQPSAGKGSLTGQVHSSDGHPAGYVSIYFAGRQIHADENGSFTFNTIEAGNYTIEAKYVGLLTQKQPVTIEANKTTAVNFVMYEDAKALQEVVVNGERTNRFANKETPFVARMPLSNLENPQVYQVVTQQLMKEQVSYSIAEAMRNAGGTVPVINPSGGLSAYFRGFGTGINARNGMESTSDRSAVDLANVERIEVLKGPSGTLFGASVSSFGGVVNLVTKKPIEAKRTEVNYTTGSFDLNRLSVDLNTPLTADKSVLFRMNTAIHKERSYLSNAFNNTFLIAPSLSYQVNEKLSLNLDAEYLKVQNTQPNNFVIRSQDVLQPKDLKLDYRKSLFYSDADVENSASRIFAEAVYKISDKFKSTTVFSYVSENVDHSYQRVVLVSSPTEISRASSIYKDVYNGYANIQQNINGEFNTGSIKHQLLVGANYRNLSSSFLFGDLQIFDKVDLTQKFSPLLRQEIDKNAVFEPYPTPTQQTISAYVSDMITIVPRLSTMLSLRVDHFNRKKVEDAEEGFKQTSLAPKFGLVYQILPERISAFANYMSGFQNIAPVIQPDGNRFVVDPIFANQAEGGIKSELFHKKLNLTASYYYIKIDNATRVNAEMFTEQDGKQVSKGAELEIIANPISGLNIIGSYAFNDNRIIKASDQAVEGNKAAFAPEHVASIWASYTFQEKIKGVGVGLGVNYVDKMYRASTNTFFIPNYTLTNATLFYNKQAWGIQLKANNVFNKQYWDNWGNLQAPSNLAANISYRF